MIYLSKSDYKTARTCSTKLYYKKLKYPATQADDEFMELLQDGGYMIDAIAKLLFPDAVIISETNIQSALQATQKLIAHENIILFEAAFFSNGKLARPDILIKDGNSFTLIEVKARSFDGAEAQDRLNASKPNIFRNKLKGEITPGWQPYLEDITFQSLILRELFPQAHVTCELIMPDKSRTTTIDNLYSLFELKQLTLDESGYPRTSVAFLGDVDQLRRDHFLSRVNVDAEVNDLLPQVRTEAVKFINSLQPLTKISTQINFGCRDCEFRVPDDEKQNGFRECWGKLATVKPHIFDMYIGSQIAGTNGPLLDELIVQGKVNLMDIPESALVKKNGSVGTRNQRQLLQLQNTRENTEWIDSVLRSILDSLAYPLHFIDFETSGLAVPYHAGMHPYETIAFQWSCHTLRSPSAELEHSEWINVEEAFPSFAFAESLMKQIGRNGTFFMWATHENTILKVIRGQMEGRYENIKLQNWLEWITDDGNGKSRLVDMNNLTIKHYFHPIMGGRTSIKKVLDAIWKTDPILRKQFPNYMKEESGEILSPYKSLPPLIIDGENILVAEGTGAIRAYQAMIYGPQKSDISIREVWKKLLLQYCELDTLAMVIIYLHWQKLLSLP
jgi:hypothetical protein